MKTLLKNFHAKIIPPKSYSQQNRIKIKNLAKENNEMLIELSKLAMKMNEELIFNNTFAEHIANRLMSFKA